MSFAGKVALITGASRGIGRAIAVEFARQGADVALVARNAQALEETAAAARDENNVVGAIQNYRQAIKLQPDWQEGLWYLGTLEYERDHYADAIPPFQRLTQLAPAAGPAWTFLGLCEYETKDYASALQHLT